MNVSIYKLYNELGDCYIGSTKQTLEKRLSGHKYSLARKNCTVRKIFEGRKIKIKLLEKCYDHNRFDREYFWLKKHKKALNKCIPWQGPKGFKLYDYQLKFASDNMKKRWRNNRKELLKNVNAHKTKEFQKMASACAHKLKYERLPLKSVFDFNNKEIGQFKTQNELAALLNIKSRKTIYRMMRGMGIFANKYRIEVCRDK